MEIILTHKEIQQIFRYCVLNNYANVVIFDEPCGGIGNLLHICKQEDWQVNKDCKKEDITDYESW